MISLPTGKVSTLNFSLSQADRDFLYTSGHDTAEAFFSAGPAGTNRFAATAEKATAREAAAVAASPAQHAAV